MDEARIERLPGFGFVQRSMTRLIAGLAGMVCSLATDQG
jgi:hypothetical protein